MRVSPPSMELCTFVNFLNRFHNAAVPKLETENESGFESQSESESELELAYNASESESESELELACSFSEYATSKNNRAKLFSLKSS